MTPLQLHTSETLDIFSSISVEEFLLPIYEGISAGFPSPAGDFEEHIIDLNKYLIKRPSSTFLGRVKGNSMKDAGIHDGDIMIIDKSLPFVNNKIAVCFLNGEFTVKRIQIKNDRCFLVAENEAYKPIEVTEENEFIVWGVVVHVIKSF